MISTKKSQVLTLRIFAVITSFLLWMYVLSSAQTQIEKKVNIKYVLPESYSIVNKVTRNISYTIKGPRAIVRNLLTKEMVVEANVKNIFKEKQLSYEISLNNASLSFPFGVEVISYEPKRVKIELDKKLSKKVAVKLKVYGDLPSDHKLIQSQIIPKVITIEGPATILSEVKELQTQLFNWSGITQSDSIKLAINSKDERIKLSQDQVDFQYEIQPTRANLLIKNVPINFLTRRIFSRVNSRFVNLMVLADDSSSIARLKKEIKIIAEIPDDATGEVEIELNASLPEGLHLLEMTPNKVKVNL